MDRRVDTRFEHGQTPVCGVLLANLGTPDQPTPAAVRRYLAEFLWDRRVVELPRPLWWLILHGIILRLRPARVARNYAAVWTDAGSPLLAIGRRQQAALQALLAKRGRGPVKVALGMRYGNPSISRALAELRAAGARRVLLLPLYPQYSAATTASTFDALAAALADWRWLPELRMVNHYHDHPAYIDALAASIEAAWGSGGRQPKLLFSFHGMPRATLLAGDPYHCECHKTARLVAARLGLADDAWAVSFQSRFGRAEWLKPYTSELLADWGRKGLSGVDVICPGFAADCLETLEEIEQENRAYFQEAGGGEFRYIAALNDRPQHIEALAEIVAQHTRGWPELLAPGLADGTRESAAADSRERALALGAER